MGADQPLAVEFDGDRVIISIGADAMLSAIRACDWWAGEEAEIDDPGAYLDAIVEELRRADFEDGQPLAFVSLSMAAENAADTEHCPGLVRRDEDLR